MRLTTAIDAIRQTLDLLVSHLVDDAPAIRIDATQSEELIVFEIHCSADDMGKLVGRSGRNIQALRTLMTAIGAKHERRVQLEVIEPDVPA